MVNESDITSYLDYFDDSYDNPTNAQINFEMEEVERILRKRKEEKLEGNLRETENNISKLKKIVLEPFAECLPGERISGIEIKRKIKLLKENGYKVRVGFWQMKSNEAWRYHNSLKKNILNTN